MRKLAIVAIGMAILASGAAEARKPQVSPEARLAKILQEYRPEKPVRCMDLQRMGSSQIIDRTAILYQSGSVYYLNRPLGGANTLRRDDILVTRTYGSQLCRGDVVRLLDSSSRFEHGFVSLGDFVPYRRIRKR